MSESFPLQNIFWAAMKNIRAAFATVMTTIATVIEIATPSGDEPAIVVLE